MRTLLAAEKKLVDEKGVPKFGVFAGEFEDLNIYDTKMKLSGITMPKAYTKFRTKEWFHAGIVLSDSYIGFAIINGKLMGVSFVSYTKQDGTGAFEHSKKGLPSKAKVPVDMLASSGGFKMAGYEVSITTGLKSGEHQIRVDVARDGDKPSVKANLKGFQDPSKIEAMIVSLPVGETGTMYSHKCVIPCTGSIEVDGKELLGSGKALMVIDFHRALYPRHTFWRWATFAGWGDDGVSIGINLTKNLIENDTEYNENGFWLGGKMTLLGPAVFEYDEKDLMKPWKLGTADGKVKLDFTPKGLKVEKVAAGIINSNFRQIYGFFSGTVVAGGKTIEIENIFGTCEAHDASW